MKTLHLIVCVLMFGPGAVLAEANELGVGQVCASVEACRELARRHEYGQIAISQGRLENFLAGGTALVMSAVLLVICRRQTGRRVCMHSGLLLMPWFALIAIALLWESGGAWGALKHPVLHAADPGLGTFSMLGALALLGVPIHVYLLWAGTLRRSYVVTSLVLFCILGAVASVFLLFLAGLASQGAGK